MLYGGYMQYWHFECKKKSGTRIKIIGTLILFVLGIGLILYGMFGG